MGTLAKNIEQSFVDSVQGEKNSTTKKLGEVRNFYYLVNPKMHKRIFFDIYTTGVLKK